VSSASLELLDSETTAPVAAIITEPLFSAGGVVEPPPGWLANIAAACQERGALLIMDESQTGLGKLGTMWGCERAGVVPDLLVISKHFGGGIAISGVAASEELEAEAIERGFVYAHSHSSDPLACSAAYAALTTIEEDGLVERSKAIGITWRAQLQALRERHESIVDVRGSGTLHAVELGRADGDPAFGLGDLVGRECLELGLLVSVRRRGSVLRFTPPFSTTDAQLEQAATLLDQALTQAALAYRGLRENPREVTG
jgi:2,2-dialkylglycine decarboxylase (pyruvate)